MPPPKQAYFEKATLVGLLFYLLVVLALPALKLLRLTPRVAHLTWWQATTLLWVPWAVLAACVVVGVGLHFLFPRRG